jgi:deoxycytidylate deaminase
MSTVYNSRYTKNETAILLAATVATMRSKDPKTKVGACILTTDNQDFLGYNGFPQEVPDSRRVWDEGSSVFSKHDLVVHAEANAFKKAMRAKADLAGATLAVTHFPCASCIKNWILGSGITRLVYWQPGPKAADIQKWEALFREQGITVIKVAAGSFMDKRLTAIISLLEMSNESSRP